MNDDNSIVSKFIFNNLSSAIMNEEKEFDFMFKLILIGTAGVGKSNILLKYTKD